MPSCIRCGRPLNDPASIRAGMGPVCQAKSGRPGARRQREDDSTIATLPFDNETGNIVCRRNPANHFDKAFNISQSIVYHSPTGMEFGYSGSGPADFALNILFVHLGRLQAEGLITFCPANRAQVKARGRGAIPYNYDGTPTREQTALEFHQEFKCQFVATLPEVGGVIMGRTIREWLIKRLF